MTAPDDRPDDAGPEDPRELPLDEELAWQQIVANYGERADLGGGAGTGPETLRANGVNEADGASGADDAPEHRSPSSDAGETAGPAPGSSSGPSPGASAFDTSYLDATDARSADDARSSRDAAGTGGIAGPGDIGRSSQAWDGAHDPPQASRRRSPDEDHFVPPEPPPIPRGTPARRLAWAGLLLPPVIMILAVGLRWVLPSWASTGLVAAFVGGFVYLVATMPRDGGDGWGDGAVV